MAARASPNTARDNGDSVKSRRKAPTGCGLLLLVGITFMLVVMSLFLVMGEYWMLHPISLRFEHPTSDIAVLISHPAYFHAWEENYLDVTVMNTNPIVTAAITGTVIVSLPLSWVARVGTEKTTALRFENLKGGQQQAARIPFTLDKWPPIYIHFALRWPPIYTDTLVFNVTLLPDNGEPVNVGSGYTVSIAPLGYMKTILKALQAVLIAFAVFGWRLAGDTIKRSLGFD